MTGDFGLFGEVNEEVIVGDIDMYEVGDVIEYDFTHSTYTLTEKDLTAVGIRIYAKSDEIQRSDYSMMLPYKGFVFLDIFLEVPEEYEGDFFDSFGYLSWASSPPYPHEFTEYMSSKTVGTSWQLAGLKPFSFLYPLS